MVARWLDGPADFATLPERPLDIDLGNGGL